MLKNTRPSIYTALLTLVFAFSINASFAEQRIKSYIDNEWQDSRYTNNGDGTITDTKTKLIWKRCPEGLSGKNCNTGAATEMNWQEALALALGKGDINFAGKSDWRVPNIKELASLAALDRVKPSINESAFPKTPYGYFWSASPDADSSYGAWQLDFDDGGDDGDSRFNNYFVRLVRGGQ